MTDKERDSAKAALNLAIERAGGVRALARLLDISGPAVSQWEVCPSSRVIEVEEKTGVDRETLRPDLFLRPRNEGGADV